MKTEGEKRRRKEYRKRKKEANRVISWAQATCERKKPYPHRPAAIEAMAFHFLRYQIEDNTLDVYQCPVCGDWHLGHKKKGGKY